MPVTHQSSLDSSFHMRRDVEGDTTSSSVVGTPRQLEAFALAMMSPPDFGAAHDNAAGIEFGVIHHMIGGFGGSGFVARSDGAQECCV